MELPDLGKQCSEPTCKKLDFLPIKCDACKETFCSDHFQFKDHNCKNSYKRDNQVPGCPLCNTPIPLKFGESPDAVVGAHIDNDCQSDPARNRREVFTNKCSFKGCKAKEIVPIICQDCNKNFCLKHRFQNDHKCTGLKNNTTRDTNRRSKSVLLNSSHSAQSSNTGQQSVDIQGYISEDEALAKALALSLNENQNKQLTQEELDFALARQLEQELNQQTTMVGGARNRDRCNLS